MLQKYYGRDSKVKKVALQSMRKQYEKLEMKEVELAANFFTRVQELTNKMKNFWENLIEQMKVEKVLRSLTPQYDMIVIEIKENKDLIIMKMEDLQDSLEAK